MRGRKCFVRLHSSSWVKQKCGKKRRWEKDKFLFDRKWSGGFGNRGNSYEWKVVKKLRTQDRTFYEFKRTKSTPSVRDTKTIPSKMYKSFSLERWMNQNLNCFLLCSMSNCTNDELHNHLLIDNLLNWRMLVVWKSGCSSVAKKNG